MKGSAKVGLKRRIAISLESSVEADSRLYDITIVLAQYILVIYSSYA
jgi:hypothetical protein